MRKTAIFTFTLLSLAILPAIAQINTGGGLGKVWTDFQSYSTELQNYLQPKEQYDNNLSETLNSVEEKQSLNALKYIAPGDYNAIGAFSIPNPVVAGKLVRDFLIKPHSIYSPEDSYSLDSKLNRFENNSAVRANLVSNELNRLITRGIAVGILGKDGQSRTKAKLESTEESLKEIASFDDDNKIQSKIQSLAGNAAAVASGTAGLAELLGLSQLQNAKIQQEQIKIVAETFAQTLQNNQSLQYSNLNLTNISQQAEEANRARRVDTSTEAARLLRATSQLDLFGRKPNK